MTPQKSVELEPSNMDHPMVGLGLPYDTYAISAGSHGVWGLDVWDPEWFPASWGPGPT